MSNNMKTMHDPTKRMSRSKSQRSYHSREVMCCLLGCCLGLTSAFAPAGMVSSLREHSSWSHGKNTAWTRKQHNEAGSSHQRVDTNTATTTGAKRRHGSYAMQRLDMAIFPFWGNDNNNSTESRADQRGSKQKKASVTIPKDQPRVLKKTDLQSETAKNNKMISASTSTSTSSTSTYEKTSPEETSMLSKVTDYLQQPFNITIPWKELAYTAGGTVCGMALSLLFIVQPYAGLSEGVQKSLVLFENVLVDLDQSYVEPVDVENLLDTALVSMLRTLDPYTEFENVGQAASLQETVLGRYGGVGLVISANKRPGAVKEENLREEIEKAIQEDSPDAVNLPSSMRDVTEDVSSDVPIDISAAEKPGDEANAGAGAGAGAGTETGAGGVLKKGKVSNVVSDKKEKMIEQQQKGKKEDDVDSIDRAGRTVTVVSAFEGYAFDAGMRVGDRITAVGGVPVKGRTINDVRDMLRGAPGSTVTIAFERDGANGKDGVMNMEVVLTRELIQIRDVKLAQLVGKPEDGIGYIQLSGFSRDAGKELQGSILALELLSPSGLNGLILDLRGNPGGLLESAVDVSAMFVPKYSDIVSAKGRAVNDVLYRSTRDPLLDSTTRLVILTDSSTASAAEIVSGAVQDLDSGVIVGANKGRTFGKGLVQSVSELPYNNALKYTVAKYYTPSGRCIQSVNYREGGVNSKSETEKFSFGADEVADKDRKVFTTAGGRIVRDGGGVEADVKVEMPKASVLEVGLQVQGAFFDYAGHYLKSHSLKSFDNVVDDNTVRDFRNFVLSRKEQYKLDIFYSQQLNALKEALKDSGVKDVDSKVKELAGSIEIELAKSFNEKERNKSIKLILEDTILSRYLPESLLIQRQLARDDQFNKAMEIAADKQMYDSILQPGDYTAWGMEEKI